MSDFLEIFSNFALVRDLILSASAMITTLVAVKGYVSWKKRENWKDDRNLAKDIMIDVYKLQLFAQEVRNPEKRNPYYDLEIKDNPTYYGEKKYKNAFAEYMKIKIHLELIILEGSILWTDFEVELFEKLNNQISKHFELMSNIVDAEDELIKSQQAGRGDQKYLLEKLNEAHKASVGQNNKEDQYLVDVNETVSQIEHLMKKYLGRPK